MITSIGLVDEVTNLRVTIRTKEILKFQWSDPYTLSGVPVLGYNVFVQITMMKDQTTSVLNNGTIYEKEIVATKDENDGFCAFVNFTIAAVNTVGIGKVTTTTEYFAEGESILRV